MPTKEEAKLKVEKLVETFKDNIKQYQQLTYKEAQVRKEFVDKFFIALGWDVNNDEGRAEQYKEVINEDAIKICGKTKAPDYSFRIGGARIFFVEAKKPSINIKDDVEPAFQLRRYAWNLKIPVSILTDFEDFVVYDCRIKPTPKDNASVGRLNCINFEKYSENFDYIWGIFSKEAVLKGSFDKYIKTSKDKKGTSEVDDDFLKQIEKWREYLAKNIAIKNPHLNVYELNHCVQTILDRIIFLRIAEDREIERYGKLKEISEEEKVYIKLLDYFKNADDKYNSGLFDLKKDQITVHLIVDDKILVPIIDALYYPKSPYDFAVLSVEILGRVYEKFLGKTVRLTASHQAKVEEKPEVRKAGGVYYTPSFVVDYIVKSTVGNLIEGKKPEEIEKIRILDPACGSGTFLVRAYSYLLDYYLNYCLKNPEKHKKEIYQVKENTWFLTTEIRKKILLNNIFGLDIDQQAVEITKLSLLLKVLENETKESVNQQLKLFQERALPNLNDNIQCGNSVVDSSYFYQGKLVESKDELIKVNPFDWENEEKGFGKILKEKGFDIIIGNPPYVKEYTNREIFEFVKRTDLKKYYQGKMDFWYLFTCKAIDLLKENGLHSFIAQNNWITSAGASILRNKILTETEMLSFFDFNEFKVFKDAGIQTMVFVLEKIKPPKRYSLDYFKVIDKKISEEELRNYLLTNKDGGKIERFKSEINPDDLKDRTITFTHSDLNEIFEKIKMNSNYKFKEEDISTGIDVHQDFVNQNSLDILKDPAIKKGDGIFCLSQKEYDRLKLTPKEKQIVKPFFTTEELFRYYGKPENKFWVIYSNIEVRKNIDDYPHIKSHLDRFKRAITSDFKPYGIHRAREQRFFEGEKILSLRKTPLPYFTYANFPCYVSQSYFVIQPKGIGLKYLTGLLNSKLIHFWLKFKGKKQGGLLQVDKAPLLDLPIYKPEKEKDIETEICSLVDSIIEMNKKIKDSELDNEKELQNKQISAFEKKIDSLVYKLYGITDEEKKIIEESLVQ